VCGHTWFVRAVRTIAIVVVHGGPLDGPGSIETRPEIGRRWDIFWIRSGVDAFDLWAGGRRDGDGEREQEGQEKHTAITEKGVVGNLLKTSLWGVNNYVIL
jgi:hypothetical protein